MAVEAPHNNHTTLFPPQQFLTNTQFIKLVHNNHLMDGGITMPESLLPPPYASCDPNKSDSGLTYHHHRIALPRKRSRQDSITDSSNALPLPLPQKTKLSSPFLHNNNNLLLHHLNNQQSEIDHLISQHTERVRVELEEQRTRESRMLLSAIQEAVMRKLKEKDDEIQRMGKLNFALQERVKSLCIENQLWRDLAQTNEATANSLRSNLEQVLAHVANDDHHHQNLNNNNNGFGYDDDAESSCGSNNNNRREEEAEDGGDSGAVRMCKKCGERESIVLLLPCRHLCLCTMCGSTVRNCPLCNSGINASVHVNLS
ncbi:hypothetical protein PIB30_023358 [Stylosanthes scabra]|uniref:RING-type domain-containing protein n=1 Tax=Stylosanthes scabra TaxID=79078 RepID=A0ABU6T960_9FABA|nr:hypothetical protein [Stylosanthes scabra]